MERVRVPRATHVAVPAPPSLPLELSKEERHRLRVARHQAFQRHQQNAAWARELLKGQAPPPSTSSSGAPRAFAARVAGLSSADVRQQLLDKQKELATMQSELVRTEQERERAEGVDDEIAALKQLSDPEAITAARERLLAERAKLLGTTDRKMEIVRL